MLLPNYIQRSNRFSILLLLFFCITSITFAQRATHLLPSFHEGRREALRSKLTPNSVAILFANPIRHRSGDVDYPYHQDPDFYYLTGFTEPNSFIMIFKDELIVNGENGNEFLFVQPNDPKAETWIGKRYGVKGVKSELGFEAAFDNNRFKKSDIDFAKLDKIYIKHPFDQISPENHSNQQLTELVGLFIEKTGKVPDKVDTTRLTKWMIELREIKHIEELQTLQEAIDITIDAHLEVMKAVEPGLYEYQVQAILEHVFFHNGAIVGFPSIVGGGNNSCILHYTSSTKKLEPRDMLVIDIGAEYGGYTADITRTLPVDGKFSQEQRAIYELVQKAQEAGFQVCRIGRKFKDPKIEATEVIKKGLKELGIINNEKEYKRYFMHGVSHHLGLDVHDVGTMDELKEGFVITVEPGIYIKEGSPCDPKWWKIGVRIEDDVLITRGGYKILSDALPREIEEIEKIMAEKSLFNEIKK